MLGTHWRLEAQRLREIKIRNHANGWAWSSPWARLCSLLPICGGRTHSRVPNAVHDRLGGRYRRLGADSGGQRRRLGCWSGVRKAPSRVDTLLLAGRYLEQNR